MEILKKLFEIAVSPTERVKVIFLLPVADDLSAVTELVSENTNKSNGTEVAKNSFY